MAHKLFWRSSDRVLILTLSGEISLEDFSQVSEDIEVMLKSVSDPLVLMIDATQVRLSKNGLSQIRKSQSYADNKLIEHLFIVASDKIIRLTLLLVFNLSRPVLRFFDRMEQAEYHLRTTVRQSPR
jgi:anti-anti-sigma regulatory factor